MGEGLKQMFHVSSSSSIRAEDDDEVGENSDSEVGENSDSDAAAESSPKDSHGHLHEFSDLVSQLPVKKGLSKFYQGKSQSFSSFSDVRTADDLAKKETPVKRTMRPSRSYAGGLNDYETHSAPPSKPQNNKAMIAKKGNPMSSCAHSITRTSSGSSYFASSKPPTIPMHNKHMV